MGGFVLLTSVLKQARPALHTLAGSTGVRSWHRSSTMQLMQIIALCGHGTPPMSSRTQSLRLSGNECVFRRWLREATCAGAPACERCITTCAATAGCSTTCTCAPPHRSLMRCAPTDPPRCAHVMSLSYPKNPPCQCDYIVTRVLCHPVLLLRSNNPGVCSRCNPTHCTVQSRVNDCGTDPDRRVGGADLLNAADWYSRHTGKPVVVLSDSLAAVLGGGDDDIDVADAVQGLSLDAAGPQQPSLTCGCQPHVDAWAPSHHRWRQLLASSCEATCVGRLRKAGAPHLLIDTVSKWPPQGCQ